MLIKYFRHFSLLVIIVAYVSGSTETMVTFPNDSIARYEREVYTKYLLFPEGSSVQVRKYFALIYSL